MPQDDDQPSVQPSGLPNDRVWNQKHRSGPTRLATWVGAIGSIIAATVALITLILTGGHKPGTRAAGGTPSASPSATIPISLKAQPLLARALHNGHVHGCVAPAQQVPGAVATIDCHAMGTDTRTGSSSGIDVTFASFGLTGPAVPYSFSPSFVVGESSGLDTYLRSLNVSASPSDTSRSCSPDSSNYACLTRRFSGYWGGSPPNGRLYARPAPGGNYFIAWTFDNDEFESENNQDFAVVATSPDLGALQQWWSTLPT